MTFTPSNSSKFDVLELTLPTDTNPPNHFLTQRTINFASYKNHDMNTSVTTPLLTIISITTTSSQNSLKNPDCPSHLQAKLQVTIDNHNIT